DDDRRAGELRMAEDGDRGEERVHVHVQDRAAGVVRRPGRDGGRCGELPPAHRSARSCGYSERRRATKWIAAPSSPRSGWWSATAASRSSRARRSASVSMYAEGTRSAKIRTPWTDSTA